VFNSTILTSGGDGGLNPLNTPFGSAPVIYPTDDASSVRVGMLELGLPLEVFSQGGGVV